MLPNDKSSKVSGLKTFQTEGQGTYWSGTHRQCASRDLQRQWHRAIAGQQRELGAVPQDRLTPELPGDGSAASAAPHQPRRHRAEPPAPRPWRTGILVNGKYSARKCSRSRNICQATALPLSTDLIRAPARHGLATRRPKRPVKPELEPDPC